MGTENYNVIVRRGPFRDKMSAAKFAGQIAQYAPSTVISVAVEPSAGRVSEGTNPLRSEPSPYWRPHWEAR